MTLNSSNPQRGTGVRKAATGVNPAVPAPAARPATARVPAVAPASAARPATGRRPGAPALGGAARPPLRSGSAAAPKGGGKGTKYLMLTIIVLLLAMVAYACIPLGGKPPLAIRLAKMYGLIKKDTGAAAPEEAVAVGLDARYSAAIKVRERAQAFLGDQEQKFKDAPQTITDVDVKHVLEGLEKFRDEVYLGVDDIGKVVAANGKDTTISADAAKEEQKKQKTAAMDLGKALQKWKGPKDQIFSKSDDFVANKFSSTPPAEPEKPREKRDPKSLLTVVAPANPNDVPKPPDPPKEDPKPAEPKPEPDKPKADPKPEPEKPKPEPEKPKPVEPKPEPEKPKEDPKPEPEKPKPEPEKPKPAEPKPEPEKPKEEPKPEPEKPKPAEPKPEPEKPAEPKPEPKAKIDVVLADADKLVLEGSPMAKDVIGASRNLPSDPDKLKTLSMKAETAQAFFIKAKDTYTGIKDIAPDSADVAGKIAKIDKILALLQNATDAINSKRK